MAHVRQPGPGRGARRPRLSCRKACARLDSTGALPHARCSARQGGVSVRRQGQVSPHCSGGCSWLYAVLPRVASWRVVVACSAVRRAASEKAKRAGPSLSTADRWSAPTRASTPSVRNSTAQRTRCRASPAFTQVLGRVQSRRGRRSGSGELSDVAEMWQRRPNPKRAAPLLPILRATPRHAAPHHATAG